MGILRPKAKIGLFDILAVTAGGIALTAHLFIFVTVVLRQFNSGWTAGTVLETGSTIIWVAQAATIPFLIFCFVYFLINLFGKRNPSMRTAAGCAVGFSFALWFGAMLILYV